MSPQATSRVKNFRLTSKRKTNIKVKVSNMNEKGLRISMLKKSMRGTKKNLLIYIYRSSRKILEIPCEESEMDFQMSKCVVTFEKIYYESINRFIDAKRQLLETINRKSVHAALHELAQLGLIVNSHNWLKKSEFELTKFGIMVAEHYVNGTPIVLADADTAAEYEYTVECIKSAIVAFAKQRVHNSTNAITVSRHFFLLKENAVKYLRELEEEKRIRVFHRKEFDFLTFGIALD